MTNESSNLSHDHANYEDEQIRLLKSIANRLEIYKLTMLYIAVLLTIWLIAKTLGLI